MKKRFLSIFLAVLMVMSLLPMVSLASGTTEIVATYYYYDSSTCSVYLYYGNEICRYAAKYVKSRQMY